MDNFNIFKIFLVLKKSSLNIILFDSIQKLPLTMWLLNVKNLHYQIPMLKKYCFRAIMHKQSLFFTPYYYLIF
jgi:hypothetical protein